MSELCPKPKESKFHLVGYFSGKCEQCGKKFRDPERKAQKKFGETMRSIEKNEIIDSKNRGKDCASSTIGTAKVV